MKHQGHYYSDLSRYIWDNLRTYNKFAVPVDYKQRDCDKVFPQFKEHLYLLLNSNIYGVIFSGYNYSQFPFMDDFQNLRSVMIDYYDRAGDNPFNSVLVDFKQAAYLVTRHVIESGCKRPVLFRHQPDHLYSSDDETNHPAYQLENGYHTAMLEHDIDSNSEVIIRQKINLEDQIRGILSRRQAPDAIICNSDNVAVKVINVALAMGLKVPDDIAVTGMYNTPWTEECQVKITSVSLEESSTAKEAVRILNSDAKEKIHLKTQPKLIIREST
jgi:DNA-binding LacI/PurR family transcriptional regulator